jgi:hypothetical protein
MGFPGAAVFGYHIHVVNLVVVEVDTAAGDLGLCLMESVSEGCRRETYLVVANAFRDHHQNALDVFFPLLVSHLRKIRMNP